MLGTRYPDLCETEKCRAPLSQTSQKRGRLGFLPRSEEHDTRAHRRSPCSAGGTDSPQELAEPGAAAALQMDVGQTSFEGN